MQCPADPGLVGACGGSLPVAASWLPPSGGWPDACDAGLFPAEPRGCSPVAKSCVLLTLPHTAFKGFNVNVPCNPA